MAESRVPERVVRTPPPKLVRSESSRPTPITKPQGQSVPTRTPLIFTPSSIGSQSSVSTTVSPSTTRLVSTPSLSVGGRLTTPPSISVGVSARSPTRPVTVSGGVSSSPKNSVGVGYSSSGQRTPVSMERPERRTVPSSSEIRYSREARQSVPVTVQHERAVRPVPLMPALPTNREFARPISVESVSQEMKEPLGMGYQGRDYQWKEPRVPPRPTRESEV